MAGQVYCFCKDVLAAHREKQYEDKPPFKYLTCGNEPRACNFFMPGASKIRPKPAPTSKRCVRCREWVEAKMCGRGSNEGKFYRKCGSCNHFVWCGLDEDREIDFNS
jgi:hypothetical protein